jgi:hypothetical protein
LDIDYWIDVTNRDTFASSNKINLGFGDKLPTTIGKFYMRPELTLNQANNLLYVAYDSSNTSIDAFSTIDNSFVASGRIQSLYQTFAVSKDGTRLYSGSAKPIVYDALTLGVIDTLDFPALAPTNANMACGRSDRIYTSYGVVVSTDSGGVRIFDAVTGALKGSTILNVGKGSFLISDDNNTLFVARIDPNTSGTPRIYRLDISTDSATIEANRILPAGSIKCWQLSADETKLYALYNNEQYIDVLDAVTLNRVDQITVPPIDDPEGYVQCFHIAGDNAYISVARDIPGSIYFYSGTVYKYVTTTMAEVESWDFVKVPRDLITSPGGEFLYTSEAIYIPLQ